MKELSLLNLSKQTLDKLQENAVKGGGLPSCMCGVISDNCKCRDGDWENAENTNLDKSNTESEAAAAKDYEPQ